MPLLTCPRSVTILTGTGILTEMVETGTLWVLIMVREAAIAGDFGPDPNPDLSCLK